MKGRVISGVLAATLALGPQALVGASASPAGGGAGSDRTTAWRDGRLQVDTEGLLSRSDLVLEEPAWRDYQSMPLGNGSIGAAVWAEDGFTAQLNRKDTFPRLKSAGQLVLPGLFDLAAAPDYEGRVDVYDGALRQTGGGMTATAFVREDTDQLVVDVEGAPPGETQTARLELWTGRTPTAYAEGEVAALAETFTDQASGTTSGAVAAVTTTGRGVQAEVVDPLTVRLTFKPRADGSFRVVVGAPAYTGGPVGPAAQQAIEGAEAPGAAAHTEAWWHDFWASAAPLKVTSPDGVGEYLEALRVQQLYTTAATQRGSIPTGQAGAANMLYSFEDQMISPDFWFHFNLRQQVFANYGADTEEFNNAYLSLYIDRLEEMLAYTRQVWGGTEGVCIPELLRFDGTGGACNGDSGPEFLNRIVTTSAEVAHNVWEQYRFTGDATVLDRGYPLMREVARFYLSLLEPGNDGKLHLHHVNALETQWDTTDPTNDVAAMKVMFPIIRNLAGERGDQALADRLAAAIPRLPDYRIVQRRGEDVLAWSATDEPGKNTQNVDLEPLMPWNQFGVDSQLMKDTFEQRVFPITREWDESPIWAARLGLTDEMVDLLVTGTQDLQKFPNGFTGHGKNEDPATVHNYFSSWNAIVASALQEGLVQAYEGVVRVNRAWPAEWTAAGSVKIPGAHLVSTEVRGGVPVYVGIQAGSDDTVTVENPWPGQKVRVVDGRTGRGAPLVRPTGDGEISFDVTRGRSYLLERLSAPHSSLRFAPVTGQAATEALRLGEKTFGVAESTPEIRSDVVKVVSPVRLDGLVRAVDGVGHHVDNSDVLVDVPASLEGTAMVRGLKSDAGRTSPAEYLNLELRKPADVYVAFDRRGEGRWWPQWLTDGGWERTDLTIPTRDFLHQLAIEPDGRARATGSSTTLTKDGVDWGDQVIDVTVQQVQVGTGIMFRASDPRNGYVWQIGGRLGSPGGLGQLQMYKMVNGATTLLGQVIPIEPAPQNQYHLRVEVVGDRIRTFLDGTLVDERSDDTFAAGRAGIRMAGSEVGEYEQFTVRTPAGATLFDDTFDGDLSKWDIPADRQDAPLVVFKRRMAAGTVTLGPNAGSGGAQQPYVTFVDDRE